MRTVSLKTPLGIAVIAGDENGISRLSLSEEEIRSEAIEDAPVELQKAATQLSEYFFGKRTDFDLKLNPQGSEFQKAVWNLLLEVPFGKTTSYMEISKRYGNPKAIRAVASANGKNPLWILIPCHRIIGSDGSLTGYAGGLWRKKWLLEHEQIEKQQSLF